jgi:hypothetical protein
LALPGFGGPAVAAPASGSTTCTLPGNAPEGVSGLVANKDGYAVVGDADTAPLKIVQLTSKCTINKVITTDVDPRNPEDLAQTSDGTYWVADIGDNTAERATIAVHAVKANGSSTLYRLSYPDGAKDAEAMVMPSDRKPVIVTKNALGAAGVYEATAAVSANRTVPLRKVGQITFAATGTAGGPVGRVGQTVVTGAALSADGKRVAIRTYTDLYEWTVAADVATALTSGKLPKPIAVPDEPQGEAVAYTTDGTALLTVSEGTAQPIRRWARVQVAAASAVPSAAAEQAGSGFSLPDLGLNGLAALVAGVGVLGLILLVIGIFGIRRARRMPPRPPRGGGPDNRLRSDRYDPPRPPRRQTATNGVRVPDRAGPVPDRAGPVPGTAKPLRADVTNRLDSPRRPGLAAGKSAQPTRGDNGRGSGRHAQPDDHHDIGRPTGLPRRSGPAAPGPVGPEVRQSRPPGRGTVYGTRRPGDEY